MNNKNSNSPKDYLTASLGLATGQICQSLGWHSIQRSSHDILTDVLERYMKQVAKTTASYCQNCCRTDPNLNDVALAFNDLAINLDELEDYIHQVEQSPAKYVSPALPLNYAESLLSFNEDGQFPPLVKTKEEVVEEEKEPEIEIKLEPIEQYEEAEKVSKTLTIKNRPNDLLIRSDSVESPPYSPLEPKSLNIDAQGFHNDMTRPGLKVATPKGYTPTLTTSPPVVGIATLTNMMKDISSSPPPRSSTSDLLVTSSNTTVSHTTTSHTTAHVSKKNTEEKKNIKSSNKFNFKEEKEISNNFLSPPYKNKSTKSSPKEKHKNSQNKKEKQKLDRKKNSMTDEKPVILLNKVVVSSVKKSSPIVHTKNIKNSDIKREFPDSPPCLSLPPKIILSSSTHTKDINIDTSFRKKKIHDIKSEPLTPSTPSRTVIFPPMDPLPSPTNIPPPLLPSPLTHSPPTLPPSIAPSPISLDASVDEPSVLISPVPTEMPVLTFNQRGDDEVKHMVEIKQEVEDMEVDIVSFSQDEEVLHHETIPPTPSLHEPPAEEKRKKKKKKSDKDKEERKSSKLESKERKEKKKKRADEKKSHVPILKLTLKMGGNPISESSKSTHHSLPPSPVNESTILSPPQISLPSPSLSSIPPTKTSTTKKSSKKIPKVKEQPPPPPQPPATKSGGFYVETLTNTSSSLGGEVYYCPGCGRPDDGSPMIGCDNCDLWYHWPCVKITVEPAEDAQWYCPKCVEGPSKKKKKKRKKEN